MNILHWVYTIAYKVCIMGIHKCLQSMYNRVASFQISVNFEEDTDGVQESAL